MEQQSTQDELSRFVQEKIEALRPRLLDLTRKNPLINVNLTNRNAPYVRVIDELPDVLLNSLSGHKPMVLSPLPALDTDPTDEATPKFLAALDQLRETNKEYLSATKLNRADNEIERTRIERELKDRVREMLKMAPRQRPPTPNTAQHAKNHLIEPAYDLPLPDMEHEDGRHTDNLIQTLLLPPQLEVLMSKLRSRCNSWEQETGINVLHVAFGLLEWQPPASGERNLSPLVLLPATLNRRRTQSGLEFSVSGTAEPELNPALLVALQNAGVMLPDKESASVEDYLQLVAQSAPKFHWKVRRQIVIGVFPSADLATYKDLDTANSNFALNDTVQDLLGGTPADGNLSPYADDYDVDAPEIEIKVPFCVLDADSSQFSALADISDGRNLAIEGPPGTGKSQTIVNAIANAMAQGRKVLFIAQKQAALNVVLDRLQDRGLGEFVLPLMPGSGGRERALKAIRSRHSMGRPRPPKMLDAMIVQRRRLRDEISEYLAIMHASFGSRDLTVHEILGSAVAWDAMLEGLPQEFQTPCFDNLDHLSKADIEHRRELASNYANAHDRTVQTATAYWRSVKIYDIDRRTANDIVEEAQSCAQLFRMQATSEEHLRRLGLNADKSENELVELANRLEKIESIAEGADLDLISRLTSRKLVDDFRSYLKNCDDLRQLDGRLAEDVVPPFDTDCANDLETAADLAKDWALTAVDAATIERTRTDRFGPLDADENALRELQAFLGHVPDLEPIAARAISEAAAIIEETDRSVLGLRTPALADETALPRLQAILQKGRALDVRRQELAQRFRLDRLPEPTQLRDAATTLRNAGAMSVLSSRYRAARRLYRSFANNHRVEAAQAAQDIDELAQWSREAADFRTNATAKQLFGEHFQALDTDFDAFAALSRYLDNIEIRCSGVALRPVREFLRKASVSELTDVPQVSVSQPELAIGALKDNLESRKRQRSAFDQQLEALESNRTRLQEPKSVNGSRLRKLSRLVVQRHQLYQLLAGERGMLELLGDNLDRFLTSDNFFDTELAVLRLLRTSEAPVEALLDHTINGRLGECAQAARESAAAMSKARDAMEKLTERAKVARDHFGTSHRSYETAERLDAAASDVDGLLAHADLAGRRREIAELSLDWIIEALQQFHGEESIDGLGDIVVAMHWRGLALLVREKYGDQLSRFRGHKLDELRSRFSRLDKEIVELSASRLAAQLASNARPPGGNGTGPVRTYTELSLIEHHLALKRSRVTARELANRAGTALRELMPIWMMSPQAVAQYLPRGEMNFDVCIIDEASQMRPEHAIGALLRCQQAVVVGDVNQMPPASFFRRMIDDDGDDDLATVEESVLELANQTFRPKRILRWHYRSRHPSLIQFSNEHMYRGEMTIFPNALDDPNLGVRINRVDGVYSGGRNPVEAEAIVKAALEHFRQDPKRSLGIVTMNLTQAELIEEMLEREIVRNSAARAFVEAREGTLEGLFVKNLENVQGDERDVIFIGTLYGPEAPGGKPAQRFGPVSGVAGQRRLNVLFSRARERVVTFTSLDSDDISATSQSNPGSHMLKSWLTYCHTGQVDPGEDTGHEPDSEFERHVADQIRSMGCEAIPQVGVNGYFIDIGIRHPEWPHGFLLGVECDGAAYHSSRSARDRDRLRQSVLEDLGWRLHRIWSTDWFRDPRGEAKKLREAIALILDERKADTRDWSNADYEGALRDEDPPMVDPRNLNSHKTPFYDVDDDNNLFTDSGRPDRGLLDKSASNEPVEEAAANVQDDARTIQVGDRVRARYLDQDMATLLVIISATKHDPANGIIGQGTPLAEVLLDREEGEEVEVLVGHRLRRAVIESIEAVPRQMIRPMGGV